MSLDSSFSARMGDKFIVSDSGTAHLNFGQFKPGGTSGTGRYGQGVSGVPGAYENYGQVPRQSVVNPVVEQRLVAPFGGASGGAVYVPVTDADGEPIEAFDSKGRPLYAPDSNPTSSQVLKPVYDKKGRSICARFESVSAPDNSFYAYLEAQVVARNTKILAQPTLLVQEGQKAIVETGQITL